MGRNRIRNKHLPPRMQLRHGAFYHLCYVDGKQKWTKLGNTFGEAMQAYVEREGIERTGSTVKDAITRYQLEILPSLAPKTQEERTRQSATLIKVFGHMHLKAVKPPHIAAYLDKREAKVAANREITYLSAVYTKAIRWGWCEANPCANVERNKESRRTRYITDAELDALKAQASEQLACIIDLAYLTAIRKADLLRIRLSDLREDGLYVLPAKTQDSTGQAMLILYSPALLDVKARAKALRRRASSMYLFATRDGTPHSISGFNSMWRRLKARCGLEDLHFHDIRAKALTDAKRARGSDYAQALGNHASVTTTEGYIKQRELNVVEALK